MPAPPRHADAAIYQNSALGTEFTHPSRSDQPSSGEENEMFDTQHLSPIETQLRLIQRDMIRVLGLPDTTAEEPEPPTQQSFK